MTIGRRRFIKLTGTTTSCACMAGAVAVAGGGCGKPASNAAPAPEGSCRKEAKRSRGPCRGCIVYPLRREGEDLAIDV